MQAECKGTYRVYEIYIRQSREDSGFIIRTANYFQAESERLINNSFRRDGVRRERKDRRCALQLSGKHLGELRGSQPVWANYPPPSRASLHPASPSQLVNHREAVCKRTARRRDPLISVEIGTKTRLRLWTTEGGVVYRRCIIWCRQGLRIFRIRRIFTREGGGRGGHVAKINTGILSSRRLCVL